MRLPFARLPPCRSCRRCGQCAAFAPCSPYLCGSSGISCVKRIVPAAPSVSCLPCPAAAGRALTRRWRGIGARTGQDADEAPVGDPQARRRLLQDDGPADDDIPDGLDEVPDAEPKIEPLHRFANRPYVVFGKEYVPNTSVQPYKARGIASWYGKSSTASGPRSASPTTCLMTAAHPTLAIPSYARVTNLANGKSVIVRVTDRGPFHSDRVIDLSYAAAYRLDYILYW